jgi:hypothetical protein
MGRCTLARIAGGLVWRTRARVRRDQDAQPKPLLGDDPAGPSFWGDGSSPRLDECCFVPTRRSPIESPTAPSVSSRAAPTGSRSARSSPVRKSSPTRYSTPRSASPANSVCVSSPQPTGETGRRRSRSACSSSRLVSVCRRSKTSRSTRGWRSCSTRSSYSRTRFSQSDNPAEFLPEVIQNAGMQVLMVLQIRQLEPEHVCGHTGEPDRHVDRGCRAGASGCIGPCLLSTYNYRRSSWLSH